jgi:hypothetical protein
LLIPIFYTKLVLTVYAILVFSPHQTTTPAEETTMETATRNELVNLYKAAIGSATKVKRNTDKLAFMSMTRQNVHAFEQYGDQLRSYEADATKARDLFAKAAWGLPASEIVSIITEATQIGAAA